MARKKKTKAAPPPQEDVPPPPAPPLPPPGSVWLFKKKLTRRDVATVGKQAGQVVIEEYLKQMKTVLDNLVEKERNFSLRITAVDSSGKKYELRFAGSTGGTYVVYNQWRNVVTFNDLREGDTIECWGNFIGEDEIQADLRIQREMPAVVNQPPENPEEKGQESPENPEEKEQESPENLEEKEQGSPENQDEKEQVPPAKLEEVTGATDLLKDVRLKALQLIDMLNIETPVEGETAETDQEPEGQIPVENRGPESEPDVVGEKQTKEPDILIEKKLDYGNVESGLYRLVLTTAAPPPQEDAATPPGQPPPPPPSPVHSVFVFKKKVPYDDVLIVEAPIPIFLFEKQLDYADVKPDLDKFLFTRCGKRLKTALDETPSIKVSTVDLFGNLKQTSLLFKRYIIGETYALECKWGQVVTENGLKEGDTVVGYGNDVGGGEYSLQLYMVMDKPPQSVTQLIRSELFENLSSDSESKNELFLIMSGRGNPVLIQELWVLAREYAERAAKKIPEYTERIPEYVERTLKWAEEIFDLVSKLWEIHTSNDDPKDDAPKDTNADAPETAGASDDIPKEAIDNQQQDKKPTHSIRNVSHWWRKRVEENHRILSKK